MVRLGTSVLVLAVVGVGVGTSPIRAQQKAEVDPKVAQILPFRPIVEGMTVDYDIPADPATCKVETGLNPPFYVLRDGQGKMLRRFVDRDGNGKLDQLSYYQDGFEVYREVDLDGKLDANRRATMDEAHWLNAGGTRVAVLKNNRVVAWKRISAEEASKVLVQAIVANDADLLATIMATPAELEALGIPAAEVDRVRKVSEGRSKELGQLIQGLVGWSKQTTWARLDAAMPHLIPSDAAPGLKDDVTLYENAVIWAGAPNGAIGNNTSFLQASELIEVGPCWKFVDLPRAINPGPGVPIVAIEGGIRSAIFRGDGPSAPAANPAKEKALANLAAFDQANAQRLNSPDKKAFADAHKERVAFVRAVSKACTQADEKLIYDKEAVGNLAAAYSSGQFPEGLKFLNQIIAGDDLKLASYTALQLINTDYQLENAAPGANTVAAQKKWLNDLKDFVGKFDKSDEAPEAYFTIAFNNELNLEEKEAREYYGKLVSQYASTSFGKKAAGALRRLDLVGTTFQLKAKSIEGQEIDASALLGKTYAVVFWSTAAPAAKVEMPEIAKLYEKYKSKGFEVISIALEVDDKAVAAQLKASPPPFPTIVEPNGVDSRLGIEFGIISMPTIFLVDAQGKVLFRSVRHPADLDLKLEKIFGPAGAGVAIKPARP